MSKDNWAVGLVHELCPICCKKINGQILIPTELTKKAKEHIEEAHGKITGFFDEPCEECAEHLSNGYIALIAIDPEKSDMSALHSIYRTGQLAWLKRDKADEFKDYLIRDQFAFIEKDFLSHLTSMVQEN